jgi:hypothetical protein
MAKRRKEESEPQEQLDFQIPKFDEAAFIKKERRNIKTLFISFLLGLLLAAICFGFWTLLVGSFLQWELVLLVGVVNMVWLRYIFLRLNIDLSDFGRRGWLTSYAMYFFTWLLLLVVLVNPPFYDVESPHMELAVLPGVQEPGGTVFFAAHIVDNVGVNKDGITFAIIDPNGTLVTPEFTFEKGILQYTYQNPAGTLGTYNYTLTATDVNHHKTVMNGSFSYQQDALEIISSQRAGIASGDVVTIKADEHISKVNFRVYYRIDNGSDLNVDRKDPSSNDKYDTSAEFQGWTQNSVLTMRVYAEARYYFANNPEKFSNTVMDTTTYTFTTVNDSNIGNEKPLVEWNDTLYAQRKSQLPNTLNYQVPFPYGLGATPGFEVLVVVVAVAIVMVLANRKKNNKKT